MTATSLALLLVPLLTRQEPDPLPPRDPAITRAELEHHVRFLAGDELEGRAVATKGSERAARYLARALQEAGVEPAGEDGGFFQKLDVRRYEYPVAPRLLCTRETGEVVEARYGVDFKLEIRGRARSTEVLPVRWFYDYTARKIPVPAIPGEAIYFAATPNQRKETFAALGIENLEDWGLQVEVNTSQKGLEAGQPMDPPSPRLVVGPERDGCELVVLRGQLRKDFEKHALTKLQLLVEEVESGGVGANVVGRLRGEGTKERPELADEVVILSAHFDHLGLRRPRKEKDESPGGDLIFNGADDDASGCAALLELGQAFAAGPRPARTLVFLFTTGEEQGGLGSRRYLETPVAPLERTVADLNLEMLGRPDEKVGGTGKLWLTGFERTSLGPAFQERGLPIAADPRPEERFFQRSDNFALALKGIVAQSLSSFNLHQDYHKVTDEADTLDYAHLEAAARLAYEAARLLADGAIQPAWNEGGQPRPVQERKPREGGEREEPREGPR